MSKLKAPPPPPYHERYLTRFCPRCRQPFGWKDRAYDRHQEREHRATEVVRLPWER
jgi:hypothetical protein